MLNESVFIKILDMKYFFMIVMGFTHSALAKSLCLSPKDANMPKVADLKIPSTSYSVGICYLAEKVKNGIFEGHHKDLIVLKKNGVAVAESETKISITVGRIDDLVLEKANDRFIAITYGAGEFCNGVVIFDAQTKKVAIQKGCLSDTDECHVVELNDARCTAKIECRDKGAEGMPPKRKEPIQAVVQLCQ